MTALFQCIPWLASSWAFKMFVNFTQVILQLHIASDFWAWCAKISERFEQQLHSSNWQRLLSDHFNLILCSWISIIDFIFSNDFLVLCTFAMQLGQLLLSIIPLICTLFFSFIKLGALPPWQNRVKFNLNFLRWLLKAPICITLKIKFER